ncbi:MAG: hypothetical protein OIN66_15655 [Candidatus Methanoperedens sp.]|nr:hypothetical protein [Candidatus Methanoperedens sp.]
MKQFVKNTLVIIFVIAVLLLSFYYLGGLKQASVLKVQVKVSGNQSSATIDNITAHVEQVSKVSEPKGTLLVTPGVTVVVMQNMEMIGEWTSVPFNGSGTYSLAVGLNRYIGPGETVRVIARVMNEKAENMDVRSQETRI